MKNILWLLLLLTFNITLAQEARDILIGGQIDLVKTDNTNFASKAQFGFEGNYFLSPAFTATGGFEIWTGNDFSAVVGARWFPTPDAFIRVRGLVGENDISLGAGWTKPLNDILKFEAMGDFYFKGDFAIRTGIVYTLRLE
jgi:hypothetical protein